MSDKLSKLQDLIKLVSESLTREEFTTAFKNVLDFVKQIEPSLDKKIETKIQDAETRLSEINLVYKETIKKIEADSTSSLSHIKKWALQEVGKLFAKSQLENKLREVDTRLAKIRDFQLPDASTLALEASKLAQDALKPLIPTLPNLEVELPQLGAPIRDSLELLPDGEKLKIEAIEKLREELDELKKLIQQKNATTYVGGGSGSGGRICKSYDLSPYLDGVTKVFSLPAMWRINSVDGSSFPNAFRRTTDWVHDPSASTITFTSEINEATTLATGQTVIINYAE